MSQLEALIRSAGAVQGAFHTVRGRPVQARVRQARVSRRAASFCLSERSGLKGVSLLGAQLDLTNHLPAVSSPPLAWPPLPPVQCST
jgi:hypothetical protein